MQFGEFAGNVPAKKWLSACVDREQFPHALLLEGPGGSGRRTLAGLLAEAAVCSGAEKPCGVCAGCVKTHTGHPDITRYGEEGAKAYPVDRIRGIRESAYVLPNEAPRRVFILAGAENMMPPAQNALLKVLEEPPQHVMFLLTCENRAQLLPTIQSRCVCLSLTGVPESEALPILRARRPDKSEEELVQACRTFGGVIGQALQGLEDESFRRVLAHAADIAGALTATDELVLVRCVAKLEKEKELLPGVLGALTLIFRDALVWRCGGKTTLSAAPEIAKALGGTYTRMQMMALLTAVESLQAARLKNMNATLLFTLLSSRLRACAAI